MECATYQDIREKLKCGDVILWKGNHLVSRIIRLWTEFSHASVVLKLDRYGSLRDRVFLVEALGTGLELRLLSKRLENYNGEAYAFLLDSIDEGKARELALNACACGIRYDYKSLIRSMFSRVSPDFRQFFCSEFVYYIWSECGVCNPGLAPYPGDLPHLARGTLYRIVQTKERT